MPPISYPGNSITKAARAKAGGGFESAIEAPASGVLGFTGTNGETVTVSGSGFTALANPQPSAFDTFNDYELAEGATIPTGSGSNYDTNLSSQADYELDDEFTIGRPLSAKSKDKKAVLNGIKENPLGPRRSNQFYYASFWIRFTESLSSPPQLSGTDQLSDKILRVWENGTDGNTATKTSFEATTKLAQYYDFESGLNFNYPDQTFVRAGQEQWHRVSYAIDRAASKQYVWIDDKKFTYDWIPATTNIADPPNPFFTEAFGFDPASASNVQETVRQWLADFYEHASPVTLELTNSSTWDDSSPPKAYMQKCLLASSTELQFELFLGDLDVDQPIYLWQRTSFTDVQLLGRVS